MNYKEEIRKHRKIIYDLEQKLKEEMDLTSKNFIGKCYKSSEKFKHMVISVEDIDDENNELDCVCLNVYFDDIIKIDTISTTIDLDDDEISIEEFNEFLNKVIEQIDVITLKD